VFECSTIDVAVRSGNYNNTYSNNCSSRLFATVIVCSSRVIAAVVAIGIACSSSRKMKLQLAVDNNNR